MCSQLLKLKKKLQYLINDPDVCISELSYDTFKEHIP